MQTIPNTTAIDSGEPKVRDEDGQKLLNVRILHGYARKSALSNDNAVLPSQEENEQKTLDEEPEIKEGYLTEQVVKISENELPCMYQWSEWNTCSETCMSTSKMPYRSRYVLKKSIIRSRGRFPSCPENLATIVERIPCNIYRCPVNLSSITEWTQCFYKNPSKGALGGCYRIRDIPTINQLIYIDTTNVTEDCECSSIIF
ncbi:Thrombospondin type-1 domain-containing protein 7B [Dirofilaria immitis]